MRTAPARSWFRATLFQLWRFDDALQPGQDHQDCDSLYVPQIGCTAGASSGWCSGRATRAVSFHRNLAIIPLSKPRANRAFAGLALESEFAAQKAVPRCGLLAVDLGTGEAQQWLPFEGVIEELYDVAVLAGTRRPMAIGLLTDEIHRVFTIDEPEPLRARPRALRAARASGTIVADQQRVET